VLQCVEVCYSVLQFVHTGFCALEPETVLCGDVLQYVLQYALQSVLQWETAFVSCFEMGRGCAVREPTAVVCCSVLQSMLQRVAACYSGMH